MNLKILQDKWNPSDTICLINCSLRSDTLTVGLAWFKSKIVSDFITVSNIDGEKLDIIVPEELKNQDDSVIRVNTVLQVIR